MKKLFLFALACLSINSSQAQQTEMKKARQVPSDHQFVSIAPGSIAPTLKSRKTTEFFASGFGKKEVVGTTTYDLQTNGSMQRRVLQSGANVNCLWTISQELNATATSSYTDRGCGYASFNGTAWSPKPTVRIEGTQRTGFGNLLIDGSGNEFVISHDGTANTLIMSKKTGSTWNTTQLTTNTPQKAIWAHAATSGNWVYVIASSSDSTIHSNGIRYGYFFSRSSDNGATWIDNMIPMPMVDSTGHYRGGGNSYSIAANGPHVSIAFGDLGTDLTLLTSHDNGATWSKKVVWDWPLNQYNFAGEVSTDTNSDNICDTLWSNDGSQSLTLNAAGDAHLAFPLVRVYKVGGAGNAGYNFFYESYLAYYNSVADSVVTIDNIFYTYRDCDGDGKFGIGDNYVGATATDPDAIYNSIGTITMPSITITSGTPERVLIAYTAIGDSDTTIDDGIHLFWGGTYPLTGQNYRDIYVIGNEGAGWTYPVNVSRTLHFEEAFPSTAPNISGNTLSILAQADIEPGTVMQNDDVADNVNLNMMILQTISIDSIFILGADSTAPCGAAEIPLATGNVHVQDQVKVYPNPSTSYFTLELPAGSQDSRYTLSDATGKIVLQGEMPARQKQVEVSLANISAGLYLLQVYHEGKNFVQKVIKE
ncbi:MAG: T9SS type A sorting domain-containing protein [Chitinophagaceae bacterium]|nr:T9SS type A sorting domain-containing protein [Chitinophagaceae bacterium]